MFDYPVRETEIKELLNIPELDISEALDILQRNHQIRNVGGFFVLPDKVWAIQRRKAAERFFQSRLSYILRASRVLSYIPFVRCVALTGSASKQVLYPFEDYDFLLITQPDRVWVTQFLLSLFRRVVSFNYHLNNFQNYCCGVILSENDLYVRNQNEFVGLEIFHSKVLFNPRLHLKFIKTNAWITNFYRIPKNNKPFPLRTLRFGIWKTLFENLVDIFIKILGVGSKLDNLLRYVIFRWFKRNQKVENFQDFSKNNKPTQIIPSGNRQPRMVQKLRDSEPTRFEDKIRFRLLKHHYARYHPSNVDIIITHGFFSVLDREERKIGKPYVPLGPLYVASYLRQLNFNVRFYDSTFKGGLRQFRNDISAFPTDIVGIYTFEPTRQNVIKMLEDCRVENYITIVGGPDASCNPQFYIDNGADLVVIGEGEETLAEILMEFRHPTKNLFQIPGVYTGKRQPFSPRGYIRNLDALPYPARDMVNFSPYFQTWQRCHKKTSLSLITSRGCPFTCNWCSKPVFGNQVRRRTPESVVHEITFLSETYHPNQFWFADDIFPTDSMWLKEFHAMMIKQHPITPFECLLRVDLADLQVFKLLKELGCFRVHFGAESGSLRVLRWMNKKIRPIQIIHAANYAHQAGIEVDLFLMLAYPGETVHDIELTRKLVRAATPDYCSIKIAKPIKGTRFYEYVAHMNSLGKNPENNRQVTFKPIYPRFFYGLAQRIINYEVILTKSTSARLRIKFFYYIHLIAYGLAKKLIT